MSIAVFDIDGVVADVRHRVHHVEQHPKDWDSFFDGAKDDPALDEGLDWVRRAATEHDIVWLTGRPEWLRPTTVAWLNRYQLPSRELIMRERRDFRPARHVKVHRLRELADREIAMFVDDDPDVISAAHAAGFDTAVLATWVPRSSGLADAQERAGRT